MCVISAPASRRRFAASVKPVSGCSRTSSIVMVSRTASRRGPSVPRRSGAFVPAIAAVSRAASPTERHSGPTVSKVPQSGTDPATDKRPWVVLNPVISFQADGIRTDPPVSEPIPAAARPKATEAAAPDDDPPGTTSGSFTLGEVAVIGFRPRPENAISDRCVLPRQTRPAAVALRSTSASVSGIRPAIRRVPASVAVPAVSNRSFQLTGTPSRGPRRRPALAR